MQYKKKMLTIQTPERLDYIHTFSPLVYVYVQKKSRIRGNGLRDSHLFHLNQRRLILMVCLFVCCSSYVAYKESIDFDLVKHSVCMLMSAFYTVNWFQNLKQNHSRVQCLAPSFAERYQMAEKASHGPTDLSSSLSKFEVSFQVSMGFNQKLYWFF